MELPFWETRLPAESTSVVDINRGRCERAQPTATNKPGRSGCTISTGLDCCAVGACEVMDQTSGCHWMAERTLWVRAHLTRARPSDNVYAYG